MIWLGIDTSTSLCRACLWHAANAHMLAEESQEIGTGHAELLIQQIDMLFDKSAYQRGDISAIACSIGPGSFTGVRVGLATAKALAQAFNVPVVNVTTLESLARDIASHTNPPEDFTVAIDARRAQVYWQNFDQNGIANTQPEIGFIDDVRQRAKPIIAGTGAPLLNAKTPFFETMATGSMQAMMQIAMHKTPSKKPLTPLYLRSADAKQPKTPFAVKRQTGITL